MRPYEIYALLYVICFFVTVIQTIVILAAGNKGENKITRREWLRYTKKATLAALLLSITAPLMLIIYILIWSIAVIALADEEKEKKDV